MNQLALDSHGSFHLVMHANPQGISGTSLVNGAKYRGTGASRFTVNGRVGTVVTVTNNFLLIGQGQAANLRVHEDVHLTIHPDGTITSFHDHFRIEPDF